MNKKRIVKAAKYIAVSGLSVAFAFASWEWYFSFFLTSILLLPIWWIDEEGLERIEKREGKSEEALKDKIFRDWQNGNLQRVSWKGHEIDEKQFKERY